MLDNLGCAISHAQFARARLLIVRERHLIPIVPEALKEVIHGYVRGPMAMIPGVQVECCHPKVGRDGHDEIVSLPQQCQVSVHVVHGQRALDLGLHQELKLVAVLGDHPRDGLLSVGAYEDRANPPEEPAQPPRLVDVVLAREALRLSVLVDAQAQVHADDRMLPPDAPLLPLDEVAQGRRGPVQVVCALRPPPEKVGQVGQAAAQPLRHVKEAVAVLDAPQVARHAHVVDAVVVHVHALERPNAVPDVGVPRAPRQRLQRAPGAPRRALVAVREVEAPLELAVDQVVLPVGVADDDPPSLEPKRKGDPQAEQLRPEPHDPPGLPYEVGGRRTGLRGGVLVLVEEPLDLPRQRGGVPLDAHVLAPGPPGAIRERGYLLRG
mmetsp:Transcript_18419/g.45233  ORF Transcript_18419/g.45233 Transcript_18419/m.45233 type:complete len:380 (-) Transcript_18419:549-1688(-)